MPHTFVIFGASGDLTSRKLVPALYRLFRKKRLPADTRIVGFSRTTFAHEAWRGELEKSTKQFVGNDFDPQLWNDFASRIFYHAGDIGHGEDFQKLGAFLDEIEKSPASTRLY